MGLAAVLIQSAEDPDSGVAAANWMLLTRNSQFLDLPFIRSRSGDLYGKPAAPLWTDDFVSLWQILKW